MVPANPRQGLFHSNLLTIESAYPMLYLYTAMSLILLVKQKWIQKVLSVFVNRTSGTLLAFKSVETVFRDHCFSRTIIRGSNPVVNVRNR